LVKSTLERGVGSRFEEGVGDGKKWP